MDERTIFFSDTHGFNPDLPSPGQASEKDTHVIFNGDVFDHTPPRAASGPAPYVQSPLCVLLRGLRRL